MIDLTCILRGSLHYGVELWLHEQIKLSSFILLITTILWFSTPFFFYSRNIFPPLFTPEGPFSFSKNQHSPNPLSQPPLTPQHPHRPPILRQQRHRPRIWPHRGPPPLGELKIRLDLIHALFLGHGQEQSHGHTGVAGHGSRLVEVIGASIALGQRRHLAVVPGGIRSFGFVGAVGLVWIGPRDWMACIAFRGVVASIRVLLREWVGRESSLVGTTGSIRSIRLIPRRRMGLVSGVAGVASRGIGGAMGGSTLLSNHAVASGTSEAQDAPTGGVPYKADQGGPWLVVVILEQHAVDIEILGESSQEPFGVDWRERFGDSRFWVGELKVVLVYYSIPIVCLSLYPLLPM